MDTTIANLQTQQAMDQSLQARIRGLNQANQDSSFRKTIQDQEAQRAALRKVAEEYEAVFLAQMMKPMFEGIETDGYFGGGQSEAIFRDLMIEEYGKMAAKNGGIGMADNIYAELIRLQEGQITPEQADKIEINRDMSKYQNRIQ